MTLDEAAEELGREQLPTRRWKLLAAVALEAAESGQYECREHLFATYLAHAYEKGYQEAVRKLGER